jgi:hypothetical protein
VKPIATCAAMDHPNQRPNGGRVTRSTPRSRAGARCAGARRSAHGS